MNGDAGIGERPGTALSVRIAVMQMKSLPGATEENLRNASSWAARAKSGGAEMLLFPELMPSGYSISRSAWTSAEGSEGAVVRWLLETAFRLGVWIGTSYLETDGTDFFNTFVLADPAGKEAGRVRKEHPAFWESFLFRGVNGSRVIETPLGRIGIALCIDGHYSATLRDLAAQDIDLLLLPHANVQPAFEKSSGAAAEIERLKDILAGLPAAHARRLGVPVALANQCGDWSPPRMVGDRQPYRFTGRSGIADSDGTVRVRMDCEEGFAAADVILDPSRKRKEVETGGGRWVYKPPKGAGILSLVEAVGYAWYRVNKGRKEAAKRQTS